MKKLVKVYWDTQDPHDHGWAYRVEGGDSGPIQGKYGESKRPSARTIRRQTGAGRGSVIKFVE
jgi:hypothetical protein